MAAQCGTKLLRLDGEEGAGFGQVKPRRNCFNGSSACAFRFQCSGRSYALRLDMFNAQESEEAMDEGLVGLAFDEYYPRRTHYLISMPCRMQ